MYSSNLFKSIFVIGLIVFGFVLSGCVTPDKKLSPDMQTIRSTEQGRVVGAQGQYGGHQWLGIPYAQAPVGEKRWSPAALPEVRSETLTATEHGSPCPQLATRLGGVRTAEEGTPVGSEDCLYLDVYAPEFSPGNVPERADRLPVMVWIHGGGNVVGHTKIYDASRLASEHNIIVVAVQYRLGPLGWFRHPSLRSGDVSSVGRSGNYALLDLIRSLKWIRNNIGSFGGNPDNVTIFGESAGGRNVYNLMLSPMAEGLFDKAIVQSGVLSTMDPVRAEQYASNGGHHSSSREVLLRLLIADGRADTRKEARSELESMDSSSIENYLYEQSPAELMDAVKSSELGIPLDPPRIFADGTVLPEEDPLEVLRDPGRYNDVPVITGTNRDETKIFMFEDRRWSSRFLWFVPQLYEPELYQVVAEYSSRQWKAHAVDQPAAVLQQSQNDVYAYRFDWDESPTILGGDLSEMLGASHGFEIPFVFGDFTFGGPMAEYLFTRENRSGRLELSEKMRTYWTEFARTGNPNSDEGSGTPTWSQWDLGSDGSKYIIFDTVKDGGLRMGYSTYDPKKLREQVREDDRLTNQRQRCVVYRGMAMYVGHFNKTDYKNMGVCKEYNWSNYPWR